jgi:apolipoprotein N-acyltransferase
VIVGIIDVERGAAPMYFNAALATGATEGAYRKRHLVPLTEYLPAFVPAAWQQEKKREAIAIFSPGADVQRLIRIGDIAVSTSICYETSYGELVRDPEGKAGLLLSLTNDDWFMGTTMPAQDNQVARMRARESGREMLHVANSGITAWIGADGRVLSELRVQERATLFARMQPRVGLTPYWRWGEWVWLVAMLITSVLVASALHETRARFCRIFRSRTH